MVAFYAIMVSMLIYNGCLFLSLRSRLYGYYLLFLATATSMCVFIDGSINSIITNDSLNITTRLSNINVMLLSLFYLLFVWEALDRLSYSKKLKKGFQVVLSIGVIITIHNTFTPAFKYAAFASQGYVTVAMPLSLFAIIKGIQSKIPSAGYLLLAEGCTVIGGTCFTLMIQDVLPVNNFTFWSAHWGFLGEAFLLSLALADQTNRAINAEVVAQQNSLKMERKAHAAREISTKAKNEFLASVSHELRTPLTSIIGFTENLLENKLVQAPGVDQAKTVLRAGKQLRHIIDDVLNISLIDTQEVSVAEQCLDTEYLIQQLHQKYRTPAHKKALHFEINKSDNLPKYITIDIDHTKQVVGQLISNAIKFTNHGKITISVDANVSDNTLLLSVIDSGIGIDNDSIQLLFQPFVQGDSGDSRQYGGTGVGLFIAKSLTELMGGSLTVESTQNVGSSFSLRLPYKTPSEEDINHIRNTQSTKKDELPVLTGKVLYAEDNEDNQNLVKLLVENTGAKLDIVSNGKQAVEAIENQPEDSYDLILMDIQMPVMNGVTATQSIKASGYKIPIVAFSASAVKSATYENIGFDGFMSKPVDRQKLFRLLSHYLTESE